jgi:5-methyltetrahydropteroyltriglutamate--homocysteine methyltransferase
MIQTCDVGSLPYTGERKTLWEGAMHYTDSLATDSAKFFEASVIHALVGKLKAGISIPAFPQFRDMNEMFLSTFKGIEKAKGGYIELGRITLKPEQGQLPEVAVIEKNAESIKAQVDNSFQLRVCITGPYTLASFLPYRTSETYKQLGDVLSEIVEKNTFAVKQGRVALIAVDEPLFGIVDDPLMDKGSEARESLLVAWESMMHEAKIRDVETCIHLHSTSDDLFWAIKSLGIVESHVAAPLYEAKATKDRLEQEDKMLKASIALSDFDQLIREKLGSNASVDALAEAWRNIKKGSVKPETFLEDVSVMKHRLAKVVKRFGIEKVVLAGPECGLRGFPTYNLAIGCLRRVSQAVEGIVGTQS